MTVVFVTAIYNLNTVSDASAIWERFAVLSESIPLYIVCSPEDAHRIPKNATPLFRSFDDLAFAQLLRKYPALPAIRNGEKDSHDFMILMNAKPEFLQMVKNTVHADHYVWIDAGIGKIFRNPQASYAAIRALTARPLNPYALFIPGCWEHNTYSLTDLTRKISWRYAGGFFVVPCDFVDPFFQACYETCQTLGDLTGVSTWEVNVWCMVESQLPIIWAKGDHNETIYAGLLSYTFS